MAKFGLGKGLESLIPESAPEAYAGNGIVMVPVARLAPNRDQPRKQFDDTSIDELATSIKRHGIIQPLVAESDGTGGYSIIAGERRWRAAQVAGLAEVPVIVREYGREKRMEVALVENVQRENLNPVDEAEAYRQLMEATGLTQEQVAERVGKSRPAVANSLRLLALPGEMMDALRSGTLSAGHARALLSVVNPADRHSLFLSCVDQGLSVREAEALAASYNRGGRAAERKPQKPAVSKVSDPDVAVLEQELIGRLGTKVSIKGSATKGSITIDYYSMDDLDRVYNLIVGEK